MHYICITKQRLLKLCEKVILQTGNVANFSRIKSTGSRPNSNHPPHRQQTHTLTQKERYKYMTTIIMIITIMTIITVITIIMIITVITIIMIITIITIIMIITVITWFSGVARDGKIIRPKAGTRKASAVFTLNGDYENDGDDAEDDDSEKYDVFEANSHLLHG